MSAEEEVAALRLMLREVGAMNANGIDYALRCQRERDEARAKLVIAHRALTKAIETIDLCKNMALLHLRERDEARRNLAAAQRELHRLAHGTEVEGDGLCPEGIRADAARAWSRLWHREARRLWREVATTRAAALREAADIARAHGGISAYYAIRKLAAEVEP